MSDSIDHFTFIFLVLVSFNKILSLGPLIKWIFMRAETKHYNKNYIINEL